MGFWLRRCAALALAVSPVACGPEIPASWHIIDILDLGMRVEVDELGPLGDPGDPMGRRFHDAMPQDRVRASIMVADVSGPIASDELSFAWYACPSSGCTADLPPDPCPEEGLRPTDECALGIQSEAYFTYADFETLDDVIGLASGTIILRAVGGLRSEGGAQACIERLRGDVDLGSCLIVEGYHPVGSLGELVALAESRGISEATGLVSETALQFPRNRVPEVESLVLTREDGTTETVARGGTVSASAGETLEFDWAPTALDREEITIVGSEGTALDYVDPLSAMWWTTQDADAFEFVPGVPRVRWVVGPDEGTFHLYVVAADGAAATGWASFTVEVSP